MSALHFAQNRNFLFFFGNEQAIAVATTTSPDVPGSLHYLVDIDKSLPTGLVSAVARPAAGHCDAGRAFPQHLNSLCDATCNSLKGSEANRSAAVRHNSSCSRSFA